MPRHLRLRMAGVPLHVTHRGNNRTPCFLEPADRRLYLGLLAEMARKTRCALHAYVLMTNHVHLLLTPIEDMGASTLLKHVAQRYTQHFNRSKGRSGTLWEGRFRSCLVDSESYLLNCHRYIELNPVRAGMVLHPRDYDWSSYAANATGAADPLITPHETYEALGESPEERRSQYRKLLDVSLPDAELDRIRTATSGGFVIGTEPFVSAMRSRFGPRATAAASGRPRRASAARREGDPFEQKTEV